MAKRKNEDLTEIFLRKYRMIQQACDETMLERIREEKDYYESFEWFCRLMQNKDPDAAIERMEQVSGATERLLCRIDQALQVYASQAREEGLQSWRQYDAIYSVYFSNSRIKIKDIAKKYGVKKSTVYHDIKTAKSRLKSILFGDETHREADK